MWIGIILGLLIAAVICGILFYFTYSNFNPERKIYNIVEFRYKIKKEKPDRFGYYDSDPIFNDGINEETKKKYDKYKRKARRICRFKYLLVYSMIVILGLGVTSGAGAIGGYLENEGLKRQVASYQASKYTIEKSLENVELTGLERLELVKQASEQNSWLAEKQYEVKQWYRFYLNKDIILELEMIDLGKGE